MHRAAVKHIHTVVGGVSPAAFVRDYQLCNRPALFRDLIVSQPSSTQETVYWPALHRWSSQGAAEALAGMQGADSDTVMVPVEVSHAGMGYNSAAEQWQRIEMPFSVFLDAFIRHKAAWNTDDGVKRVGYMAQFDLLSAVSRLAEDAPGLPHTRAGPKQDREQWRSNTWIGPAHTFTPLHRDPYHNLLVQVVGHKRVHLLPPTLAAQLLTRGGNTVPDVLQESDLLQGTNTALQAALPHLLQADLNAGDVLYIPHGWLHCVQSLATSVSVNFWYR